jgi:hypothetical protein
MKTYGGVDLYTHVFFTSALVGAELLVSHPQLLYRLGKEPPATHWTGGWVNPAIGLHKVERRILFLSGFKLRPLAIQLIASHCTDYLDVAHGLILFSKITDS